MTRCTSRPRHVRLHLVEETPELGSPVPGEALADDPAGGDVEGGKQCRRAVPFVAVAAPLDLAGPHGQQRLRAVERLDLAFLVDTQHQRTLGRGHAKANDVAHFRDKVPRKRCAFRWVGRELGRFCPVRRQAERAPCRANSSACRPPAGFPACGRSPPRPAHLRPCGARLAVARRASPPSGARQSGAAICAPWPDARRAAPRSAGNCRPHWPPARSAPAPPNPAPSGAGPPGPPTQHAPRPSRPPLANKGCPCRCSAEIGAVWHQAAIRTK